MTNMDKQHILNVFNRISETIFWMDLEGRIVECNVLQARVFGLEKTADLIGKNIFDIAKIMNWPEATADKIRINDESVLTTQKKIIFEEVIVMDNQSKIFLSMKEPWYDENNNLLGILGIGIDITEKREAEKYQHEKDEAEKKAHYINLVAGSIAHDLRTPLATVSCATKAIESVLPYLLDAYQQAHTAGLAVKPIHGKKLYSIKNAMTGCENAINYANHYIDLMLGNLNYDKINTHHYDICNINQVINDALKSYPYQAEEKSLLHWSPQVNFNFWGCNFYLKNVLNNLLKNSFFYIKKYERGEIFIQTVETDQFYTLCFKDTAQGVPPDLLDKMFDGFFSKRKGGTGLGLTFCKSIMQSFGGDISVESEEGIFIEFTLFFPKNY